MALLPLNLDYTDKDHASLRARLFNLVGSVFPDWTDREIANFGNILIELFAHVGDVVLFYQDNQAKESRLSDATLRRNVLALAKMLNYIPEGNGAASANVLITLPEVPAISVLLEAGRIYETKEVLNRQSFQQLFDVTIPAGLDPPQIFVLVENSSDVSENFSASGLPGQELVFTRTPFLDGSEVITAGNGGYTQVDSFLGSTSADRHYTLQVDANGRARLRFGSGTSGEIPSGTIGSFYKIGGGADGRVDENTITRIVGTIKDTVGGRVRATATNPDAATGGQDRETISSIKQKAPPSTKITDRTVALDDYELGAENLEGVARSLMITSDQVVGVPENRGFLYIVPEGGGVSTSELKATVQNEMTVVRPKTITFKFTVEDAAYLTVNVSARVFFTTGFNETAKRNAVTGINTVLTDYFQISNSDGTPNELVKFGHKYGADSTLPLSDIFCAVEGTAGVRKLGAGDTHFLLNLVHDDVPLQFFEFPLLGTVDIIDGDTGLPVLPL